MLQRTSSQRLPPKTARSSMPGSLLTGLGLLLTFSALDPVFAQPAPQPIHRIIVGEISRGCSRDGESTRTVMSRLRQGGVNVDGTPLGRPECVGPDCAEKLKDREGYLLGGDVRKGESTLWLVDLKTDQIHIQRHLSNGEVEPAVLARQAGALLDVLHDPLTRWTPRKGVPMCREDLPDVPPEETAESTQPAARSDLRIALAVYAPRSIEKYAAEFQKGARRALSEMGLDVREVRGLPPPANPRGALPPTLRDLPLLDIQLLAPEGDQAKPTPDGAAIRLSESQGATQTTLDCATQDCSPAQLVRLVRRNAGALVDQGGEPRHGVSMQRAAGIGCLSELPVCGRYTAQAPSGSTNPPGQSAPSQPFALAPPSPQSPAPSSNTQPSKTLRPLAWTGIGLGAVGMIVSSAVYFALQGQEKDSPSGREKIIITNATPAWAGFAGGAAVAAVGIGFLIYDSKRSK